MRPSKSIKRKQRVAEEEGEGEGDGGRMIATKVRTKTRIMCC